MVSEAKLEYQRKYYHKNKERFKEYAKKNSQIQKERRKKNRLEVVERLGGKCSRCGYNEFTSSISIHHLENQRKDGKYRAELFSTLKNVDIKKLLLLCYNCHFALHKEKWAL